MNREGNKIAVVS